ncbi:MAG: hypothetical protein ABIU77_03350 [Ferruginibacter sp.]
MRKIIIFKIESLLPSLAESYFFPYSKPLKSIQYAIFIPGALCSIRKRFWKFQIIFPGAGLYNYVGCRGYAGLEKDGCKFILQQYDNKTFAENFMLTVKVSNAAEFYHLVIEKKLPEKYGIKVLPPKQRPYGKEVNIIDIAGVCWHFVE